MNQGQPAAFKFENYRITQFGFNSPVEETEEKIHLHFYPKGIYNIDDGIFILFLDFKSTVESLEVPLITITVEALFKFNQPGEQVPDYFYNNSIAIVFPYLRAFVSTLTSLANDRHMLLPIMNLSNLRQELIDNTTFISNSDNTNSNQHTAK
jgi:preprotein translocase subunit SecB